MPPYTCSQPLDVGMWFAAGLGGQFIVGHRALDLVLVVKNSPSGADALWADVRPALVALDPEHPGDEAASAPTTPPAPTRPICASTVG